MTALYRACALEVKKHSVLVTVKAVQVNDLESGEKGERPVGVPAARGHGVMEV
jgi:hypothetical protein